MYKSFRSDVVGGNIQILQLIETFAACIVQFGEVKSSLILDDIAFNIEARKLATLNSSAKGLHSFGGKLVHLKVQTSDMFISVEVSLEEQSNG